MICEMGIASCEQLIGTAFFGAGMSTLLLFSSIIFILMKDICSLVKHEARRAIPQATLTRRREVADKAVAKQRKIFDKMEKKKWWA